MRTYENHETVPELAQPLAAEELAKVAIDWRKLVEAVAADPQATGESPSYDAISQNALLVREADRKRQDAYNWQQLHPLPEGGA